MTSSLIDLPGDGMYRVAWLTACAEPSAPTVTELTAGLDLTPRLTPDGLQTNPTTADVDTGSLASTVDTNEVGRVSWDNQLTLKRATPGDDADEPFDTLKYGVHGFLVVRRAIAYATDWAAAQVVAVFPSVCGEQAPQTAAKNEVLKYTVPLKTTGQTYTAAIVAAGGAGATQSTAKKSAA
jgi:hypothetical protein